MTTTKSTTTKSTKATTTKGTARRAAKAPKEAKAAAPAKAPRAKAAKAPEVIVAATAPEVTAPAEAPAADVRPADGMTQRQLTNAIKALTPAQREEMHTALLGVDVPRNKDGKVTMTTTKLSSLLAATIKGGDGSLPEVVATALKPRRARRASGPATPKRIDRIVDMLREGATVADVAADLVGGFPHRKDGRAATEEWYRSYTRNAIRSLNKGTVRKFTAEVKAVVESDGVWKIQAA